MSNYLAVATVTETIAQVIRDAVSPVVPGAEVTTDRPDKAAKDAAARVNVYLYQVAPNPALRNSDLPMRQPDGSLASRPRTALDLFYLINFYGRDEQLIGQQLLGLTAAALHEHAILTRGDILRAIEAAPGGFLNGSNLAEQSEAIKISPNAMALEELSKLWSMAFQVPYTLSVAYQASVVLIDGSPVPTALPVRSAPPSVGPGSAARVDSIAADGAAGTPIVMGSTLVVRGRGFGGAGTTVQVGGIVLTPLAGDVGDTQVKVALTDSRLASGTNSLSVLVPGAAPSSPARFVIQPTITAVRLKKATGGGDASLRITLDPTVWTTDAVTVMLNRTGSSVGSPPSAYAFDVATPPATDTPQRVPTVAVPIPGVTSGTYLVRVSVNGVESPLNVANGVYASPKVKVP
ncbi:MAG TPA: DUF4255 domain-containing protein [Longimicrobium sp.]|nr:DUF4255 domain-containing protein [Longimicrobium sp.]